MMSEWIKKLKRKLTGEAWAEETIERFLKAFPGRCPVCAFHRYGLQNGHTKDLKPKQHWCPESEGDDE
jgi:hypothetical protein